MLNTSQALYDNSIYKYRNTKFTITIFYQDQPDLELTGDDLESATIEEKLSPISTAIYANTLTFTILDPQGIFDPLNPVNDLDAFKTASSFEVRLAVLNRQSDVWIWTPGGRFYFDRLSYKNSKLTITAYSSLKLLSSQTFYQYPTKDRWTNIPFLGQLVRLIFEDTGIKYKLEDDFTNALFTGYIPVCSKLDALLYIAVGCGLTVRDSREGYVSIARRTPENSANLIITADTIFKTYTVCGSGALLKSTRDNLPASLLANNPQLIKVDPAGVSNLTPTEGKIYKQLTVAGTNIGEQEVSKTLFEGTVVPDESGKAIIDLGCPASVDEITGASTYSTFLSAVEITGSPGESITVNISGKPYTLSKVTATKILAETGPILEMKSANTLPLLGLNWLSFYSEKINHPFTFAFSWVSVPTVEAGDYVIVKTKYSREYTVQITKNKINLKGLISSIEAE